MSATAIPGNLKLQITEQGTTSGWRLRVWLPAVLVSLVLLGFVIGQADFHFLGSLWRRADLAYLLLGSLGVALDGFLTAWRLRVLHLGRPRRTYGVYLRIVVLHGYLLQLLPARLGELPYLVMMRRRLGMPTGEVFASFIYQRLLDSMVLGLFFLSALVLMLGDRHDLGAWLPAVGAICALFLLAFLQVEWFATVFARIMHRFHSGGNAVTRWWLKALLAARRWSQRLRANQVRWKAVTLSFLRWSAEMVTIWATFRVFGIQLGIVEVLFLGAGLMFVAVIPLQAIGGFGVSEAGLAGLLVATGYPWQEATATALVVRVAIVITQLAGLALAGFGARWASHR